MNSAPETDAAANQLDAVTAAGPRRQELRGRLELRLPEVAREALPVLGDLDDKYTWVAPAILRRNREISQCAPELLADYNRYILVSYLATFTLEDARYRLPASVCALYGPELARILRQLQTLDDDFFNLSNDRFRKDLAIVTHRLIPVGAEFAEGGAGVPRRVLFANGIRQLVAAAWFIAVRCGGLRPFFALHAHTLSLERFSPEGWLESYHRLAELLELNPRRRGWISASWFLDPGLATISPHLAYLREVPSENGATLLFVCHHRDGSSGALTRSSVRQSLFAEGKYVPASYMRIWPRRSLIAWSRRVDRG
jgi:hypothetical protein